MTSDCFVDTNIFLYAKDPKAPSKRAVAIEWLEGLAARNRLVVSPQVMNEFAHNVIRKFPHLSADDLLDSLESMRPWCRASIDDETALHGFVVHRRYKFSFYDSTLVAAALDHGCTTFLSEDLTRDQIVEGLKIVNPFKTDLRSFLG